MRPHAGSSGSASRRRSRPRRGARGHYVTRGEDTLLTHDGIGDAVLVSQVDAAAVALVAQAGGAGVERAIYLREPDISVSTATKRTLQ